MVLEWVAIWHLGSDTSVRYLTHIIELYTVFLIVLGVTLLP